MLNVEEVAKRLSVSEMTIYRWISKGKLKAYKMGRNLMRIKEEDLERFLEGRKIKNADDK